MNGLDMREWDPAADALLPAAARFSCAADVAAGKAAAKRAAQRRFGLAVRRGLLEPCSGVGAMLGTSCWTREPGLQTAPATLVPRLRSASQEPGGEGRDLAALAAAGGAHGRRRARARRRMRARRCWCTWAG